MRPKNSDQAEGRFIACKPGFYDPEVFKKGREVTLTGKIIHIDVRKVGEYDYHFPVVDIEFMILWPKRQEQGLLTALPALLLALPVLRPSLLALSLFSKTKKMSAI